MPFMRYAAHLDLIAMSASLNGIAERPLTTETIAACRQHVDRLSALLSNAQPYTDDQATPLQD
jgi:hypothetical protein